MREPARGAVWPQALALPPREVCVGQEKTAQEWTDLGSPLAAMTYHCDPGRVM